jgi:hypothetical protein
MGARSLRGVGFKAIGCGSRARSLHCLGAILAMRGVGTRAAAVNTLLTIEPPPGFIGLYLVPLFYATGEQLTTELAAYLTVRQHLRGRN